LIVLGRLYSVLEPELSPVTINPSLGRMPAPGEPVRRSPVLITDQRAHALGPLTTEMFSKECSGQLYSCCYPVQVVFVPKRVSSFRSYVHSHFCLLALLPGDDVCLASA
jgi:hypothetical protein